MRLRTSLLGFVLAAALVAGRASADDQRARPPPVPREDEKKQPDGPEQAAPLSAEDAALIRELALLERVELLRHLELFEPTQERARPTRRN